MMRKCDGEMLIMCGLENVGDQVLSWRYEYLIKSEGKKIRQHFPWGACTDLHIFDSAS